MPTPVTTARQCLTPEAARALDDAVTAAHRRSHSQTTSLHLVAALLAASSSPLTAACAVAPTRTAASYSSRLQLKALDLCLGVALDRLPSSQHRLDDPPVSNSLMAAIKRSQANQRRLPETFHLHQLQQSSLSSVKVELRQLILSVLDDPVVSRVFGEAGFRSWDIKLAIVRPPPPPASAQLGRTMSRCPPLFLCNLSEQSYKGSSVPLCSGDDDECCRRIAEVLVRKKGRNPLVIGACAGDAVRIFCENVERSKGGKGGVLLGGEVCRLKIVCIEKEVFRFVSGIRSERSLCEKFEEMGEVAENCGVVTEGVVVKFGELKGFVEGESEDAKCYVVSQMMRLLKHYSEKLWLMVEASRYETYLKFITTFPSIEKDWDLHILPITSFSRPPSISIGGIPSKSYSFKESFVPLGGFFSTLPGFESPMSSAYQSTSRCCLCNEKYEQELSAISKGECLSSVADQFQGSLPSWMQSFELCRSTGLDIPKAKDGVLNAIHMGLQRKWNDVCRRLHYNSPTSGADTNKVVGNVASGILGFTTVVSNSKDTGYYQSSNNANASPRDGISSSMHLDLQKIDLPYWNVPLAMVSKVNNGNHSSKLQVKPSVSEFHQNEVSCPPSDPGFTDSHESPSNGSVMTDIGLGVIHASVWKEPNSYQTHKDHDHNFSIHFPPMVKIINKNLADRPAQSSSWFGHASSEKDLGDFKMLWKGLTEKVGRQDQAIRAVSHTIARCRTENGWHRGASLRRDIWLSFLGPDRVAKKQVAVALAELVFGNREKAICVDLSSQSELNLNGYDPNFRGKTIVDLIAGEISRKPLSVVFLENVEKADPVAQKRLSEAIMTGKFSDSHGRQIGINNVIFVITSSMIMKDNKTFSSRKEPWQAFEDRILAARCLQLQILIKYPDSINLTHSSNVLITSNKQKPIETAMESTAEEVGNRSCKGLDLNLPVEEAEVDEVDWRSNEVGSISDKPESNWLEEFLSQVDDTVVFETFDFHALTDKLLKVMGKCFQNAIGPDGLLEIDSEVMEQIVGAAWSSNNETTVEDWVELVLGPSLSEARHRYSLSAGSVLKLVACDEGVVVMEEGAHGVRLPARIILN